MKIAFFDAKSYDKEFFRADSNANNYDIKFFETKLTIDTVALTVGFDVVCVFVNDTLTKQVIDRLKENGIKLIALRCAGYNNLDVTALDQNIRAVRVPDYSPNAVAEHAVALIMTLNRKCHKAYYRTKEHNFSLKGLMGFDINGKTIGIIGTGRIGQVFIKIMKGFGANVIAYDLFPNSLKASELGFSYVKLDNIFTKSDIISLHCPLTKETENIINRDSIQQMKQGVMLINTSRGDLINTSDLLEGLRTGKIGSAGLDVYEEESEYFYRDLSDIIISDEKLTILLTLPNVILTSHQAYFTKEALNNIAKTTFDNIREFEEDRPLTWEVK